MHFTLPEIPCVTPIGLLELHEDPCRLPFSRARFSRADLCADLCADLGADVRAEFALRAEIFIDALSSRAASPMATLAPITTGSVPSGVMGCVRDLDPSDLDPSDLDPSDLDPSDLDPSDLDPSTRVQQTKEAIMIHSGG